ncbi:2-keto-4-pentenoate hydratase [Paracoccus sp. APAP_BH8]|uniref:2-keto-4-pentenoate hydratase n=1 Tax=Paracoccus sp. APAP_BH8 TaxID=3110237 RepID=UPI003FA792F1
MKMDTATQIAEAFYNARKRGSFLAEFPGPLPSDLTEAYAIQDCEIALSEQGPSGWKVASIHPELQASFGAHRLSGPVMRLIDRTDSAEEFFEVSVIAGGFAAVEAEFAFRLGRDIPAGACAEDLNAAVAAMHVAVEIAGSPLASLNDLGPVAVVSDHGNNAGLIVGPEVMNWRERPVEKLTTQVEIDGEAVGEGSAARLQGGPFGALAWLADHLAQRGHSLKSGMWISTGATTGVHRISPHQRAVVRFPKIAELKFNVIG